LKADLANVLSGTVLALLAARRPSKVTSQPPAAEV